MIRSRIKVVPFAPLSIDITVICFENATGSYVYSVDPVLQWWEPVEEHSVFWHIDLQHQLIGIARNYTVIEDAVEDGARDVITDFIYAHEHNSN